jgi:hypothetical protein
MQERIPVDWVLGSQTAKQRIGIGQYVRIQEVIKT